jgi:hypothetical protein
MYQGMLRHHQSALFVTCNSWVCTAVGLKHSYMRQERCDSTPACSATCDCGEVKDQVHKLPFVHKVGCASHACDHTPSMKDFRTVQEAQFQCVGHAEWDLGTGEARAVYPNGSARWCRS